MPRRPSEELTCQGFARRPGLDAPGAASLARVAALGRMGAFIALPFGRNGHVEAPFVAALATAHGNLDPTAPRLRPGHERHPCHVPARGTRCWKRLTVVHRLRHRNSPWFSRRSSIEATKLGHRTLVAPAVVFPSEQDCALNVLDTPLESTVLAAHVDFDHVARAPCGPEWFPTVSATLGAEQRRRRDRRAFRNGSHGELDDSLSAW